MLQTRFLFALLFDNVSRQAWSQIPCTAKNDLKLLILHLEYFDYTCIPHPVLRSTENLTQYNFMYARQVLWQLSYISSIIQPFPHVFISCEVYRLSFELRLIS